ncbi:MAG: AEC family transporter [Faecalicoccus sp.]|nr:AEC family transporter [Faecalicoccus sp.]
MDISVIINTMLELFIMMAIGYILMKKQWIDDAFTSKLNFMVLNVTTPFLILNSVYSQKPDDKSIVFLLIGIGILLYLAVLPVLSLVVVKILRIEPEKQGIYRFMTIYANTGFMGFPVMNALYGAFGVFCMAMINMLFNVSVFTYGIYLMTKGQDTGKAFNMKSLMTPAIIMSVIGIFLFIFEIGMPSPILNVASSVGSMTTPLAMILIGASLSKMNVKELFGDVQLLIFSFVKMLILPAIAYLCLMPFTMDPVIKACILMIIALPVGNMTVLLANQYKVHQELAAKSVFITTLASLLTIPIVAVLFL